MYGFWERAGTFAIAAAVLFVANRLHKSTGKHTKVSKPAGIIMAFFAGCAFLITFVGGWIAGLPGAISIAGLIVCAGTVAIDWFLDGKPDRPAFFAALLLAMFMVTGVAHLPQATNQIGTGVQQVTSKIGK